VILVCSRLQYRSSFDLAQILNVVDRSSGISDVVPRAGRPATCTELTRIDGLSRPKGNPAGAYAATGRMTISSFVERAKNSTEGSRSRVSDQVHIPGVSPDA
jgi:hypothetical protein